MDRLTQARAQFAQYRTMFPEDELHGDVLRLAADTLQTDEFDRLQTEAIQTGQPANWDPMISRVYGRDWRRG